MKGLILFLIVVLSVFTIMNLTAYMWVRFMFRPTGMTKHIIVGLFWSLSLVMIAGRVLSSLKGNALSGYLIQIGYTWVGFLFYFVVLGMITGIIYQGIRLLSKLNWINLSVDILQTGFPNIGSIIIGLLVALAIHGALSIRNPKLLTHELVLADGKGNGQALTVVQLSDLHLNRNKDPQWWERIVETTNGQNPDIIVLTGDTFDEHPHELEAFIPGVQALRAKHGVFAVTGNHEFYTHLEQGLSMLTRAGVTVLRNDILVIPEIACIVGIDDPTGIRAAGMDPPDFEAISARIPADLPTIVLNHQPMYIEEIQSLGADLQVSGHTHDGQIWPFKFLNRIVFKYQNGLFQFDDLYLYVSAGTGTWGPPFRIGTQSEITVFQLNAATVERK